MTRRFTLPAALLLLTALMAGCLSGDSVERDATPEEAYETLTAAIANMDPDSEDFPARSSLTMRMEARDDSSDYWMEAAAFLDRDVGVVVITMEGEGDDASSEMGPALDGGFMMAQAWQTTFFGPPTALVGTYDESADPPQSFGDADGGGMGGETSPEDFFAYLQDLDLEDLQDARVITYRGEPTIEVTFAYTEDEATFTGTFAAFMEPALLAYVEATVQDPDSDDEFERDGHFRMDAYYGADATHPLEDAVKRLETMTLLRESDLQGGGMFGSEGGDPDANGVTYTVQPSHFEAYRTALDQVQAHVIDADDEDAGPALTMFLDEGEAENEDVRVIFTDVDGDGLVSPGDTLRLEWKTERGEDYTVGLFDEESGILLLPGPGVLAVLAALSGLAVVRRFTRTD